MRFDFAARLFTIVFASALPWAVHAAEAAKAPGAKADASSLARGKYLVTIGGDCPNGARTHCALPVGGSRSGNLLDDYDNDVFVANLTAGRRYTATLTVGRWGWSATSLVLCLRA